jgi:hypothetical protein
MKEQQGFTPETRVHKSPGIAFLWALLGAVVGAIPWFLLWGLTGFLMPLFALLIGVCSDLSYHRFGGRAPGNKLPNSILLASIISILLGTYFACFLQGVVIGNIGFIASAKSFFATFAQGGYERTKIIIVMVGALFAASFGASFRIIKSSFKNQPPPGALPPR